MIYMKSKIERIKFLLNEAYRSLNSITESNFDETLRNVKAMLDESRKHRAFLLAGYSKAELKVFEPDLTKLTKQIKDCFDNNIKNKKLEVDKVLRQIKYTQNKKKLVNYIR